MKQTLVSLYKKINRNQFRNFLMKCNDVTLALEIEIKEAAQMYIAKKG